MCESPPASAASKIPSLPPIEGWQQQPTISLAINSYGETSAALWVQWRSICHS